MPSRQPDAQQALAPSTVPGRVVYFLILVILNQFTWPITQYGPTYLIIYQLLYASMFVAGIWLASDNRRHQVVTSVTAVVFLVAGFWYALDTSVTWRVALTYVALIPFLATVMLVLLRYIFMTPTVTRDVLYAATSVYILLGAIFVPIYGLLDLMLTGSFVDGAVGAGQPVVWQQFIYYSYVTLTTAGYGDVLPVSWWARSLASAEAVIGVLYIAIMMARLVGLYAQDRE